MQARQCWNSFVAGGIHAGAVNLAGLAGPMVRAGLETLHCYRVKSI